MIDENITLHQFGELWTSGKLAEMYPAQLTRPTADTVRTDKVLQRYIYPAVGNVVVRDLTITHAREVMHSLPKDLSPATQRNIAGRLRRLLAIAVSPTGILRSNPWSRELLPRHNQSQSPLFLTPDEDRALLANTTVPFLRRLLYGTMVREGFRLQEALRLPWTDIDENGAVRVKDKTSIRQWLLCPDVHRALLAWHTLRNKQGIQSPFVFPMSPHSAMSFRANLQNSGIARLDLFTIGSGHNPVNVHDLRHTFVILAMANGRSDQWICDRAGVLMPGRFRRAAQIAFHLQLGLLTPLDEAIPELKKGT